MKNLKIFTIQATGTLLYQGLSLLFNFFLSVVIARTLGPSGKGLFSVYILIPSLLSMLLTLSIDESNVYFASKGYSIRDIFLVNSLYTVLASGGLFIIFFLFPSLFSYFFKNVGEHFLFYAILITPLFLFFRNIRTIFLGAGKVGIFNFLDTARIGILFLLVYLMFAFFKHDVYHALQAINYHIVLASLIALFAIIPLLKEGNVHIPLRELIGKELKYGIRAYLGITMNFFNKRLDVFILNYFKTPYEVGIYSISTAMAELIWKIPNSIATPLFPHVARQKRKESVEFTLFIVRFTFSIIVIVALIMAIIGKPFISLVFGRSFIPSFIPFLWLLPGVIFLSMGRVLSAFFHGINKPEYGSFFTIISVAFTVVFDLILIPKYGAQGAAIASTVAYTVSGVIAAFLFSYETKVPFYLMFTPPFRETIKILKRN